MIGIGSTLGMLAATLQGNAIAPSGPLTIDQAVRIAEANAFSVRLQKSVIEKNRIKVQEAKGNLGPQLSIGANYTRYDQALTTSFGAGSPPVIIQPIDSKVATATLALAIDIAGNRGRLLQASSLNRKASEISLQSTYNDTKLAVRQAYLSVLRTQAQVHVAELALNDSKERLDQGQKQFDQAQVAKLDVTRYQAQVAQSQSDLIAAKDALTLAKYSLNLSLARPIESSVEVVDLDQLPSQDYEEGQLVAAAQGKRPEVVSATTSLKALKLITRATEAGLNPSLNLQVQYQTTIDPQGFSSRSQSTVGNLILSIPIFDSGVTRSKVKEARQDEVQASISLDQTKLSISQEVRNAIANLTSAKARIQNANEQVKLAEEVYRLAKVKQDAGAGTYYEVIDAETQLTQARNGQIGARYDYLISYSQLQRAVGQDDLAAAVSNLNSAQQGKK